MPVLLVTGASGQVGFELVRELASLGNVVAPPRSELDLSRPETIRAVVRRVRPSVIVNAGAYTSVDKAESEKALCFAINAEAPGILAEEARLIGSALIHYSTDYVFDGRKTSPYLETDDPAHLNVYGESKLAGERAIEAVGKSWIILRTSWVYGTRRDNFLSTMLRMARQREEVRVVDDQVGAPTWSRSIAVVTGQLLSMANAAGGFVEGVGAAEGTYHLSSAGMTSWHGFATAILARDPARYEQRCTRLIPIPTEEYPTPAIRPRWSVLSNAKLTERFGLHLPSWESQLDLVLTPSPGAAQPVSSEL